MSVDQTAEIPGQMSIEDILTPAPASSDTPVPAPGQMNSPAGPR